MIHAIKHTDINGTWLDFTEVERGVIAESLIENPVPRVAAQISPNPDHNTPLNMYWWGESNIDQVVHFFSDIVEKKHNSEHGVIKAVEYGSDWKHITKFSISEFLSIKNADYSFFRLDTLSIRLDYDPSADDSTDSNLDNTTISVWSRFDSPPCENDPDAIESVGVYMPLAEFYANADRVEKFVAATSIRPLRPAEFSKVLKHISKIVPS